MIVKLKPAVKSLIWGGRKLIDKWNKPCGDNVAETWELSFHRGGPSLIDGGVNSGKKLCAVANKQDWGAKCHGFGFFPVLCKLIDAAFPLSVQVHPDDTYALAHEGQYGKTEMWHILSSDNGYIYLGLNTPLTRGQFISGAQNGDICKYLNRIPVSAGQTYFIPSGTVHAIGAGVTLYEVQQNSDLTYRVYDYGRVDKDGNQRELHLEKAAEVANLDKYIVPDPQRSALLGKCGYFSVYRYHGERRLGKLNSFTCVTAVEGNISLGQLYLKQGETAFMSAGESALVRGAGCYIVTCVE